jgi:hypothetical protein
MKSRRSLAQAEATQSPVVEKVTRTRVVSAKELAREKSTVTPEFWDYIESLRPEQWATHIVYIYREDPRASQYTGQSSAIDKCTGFIDMPSGVRIPFNDREEVELAIREKFGGRAFRLIVKNGSERVTEGKSVNEAPPKFPVMASTAANGQPAAPTAMQDASSVAVKAIDAMSQQQPDAIRLSMDVLKMASDVLSKKAEVAPPATDPLRDRLMDALLQRFLDPPKPPDTLDLILKAKELFAAPSPAKSGVNETLELITALKTSGLVNLGGKGAGLLEMAGSVIPSLANAAIQATHEWRLGMEAQARVIAARGGAAVIDQQQPPQTNPPAALPETPAPPPAAPQEAAAVPDTNPPFQWIETKIVEILQDTTYTIDQAVDETLAFLYRAHPAAVAMLLDPPKLHSMLSPGEKGLLQLFQNEPILKQIPVNPRLVEFIKKFIAAAQEAEQERRQAAAAPGNASPADLPPQAK